MSDETHRKRFLRGSGAQVRWCSSRPPRSPRAGWWAPALFTSGAFTHLRERLQLRTVRDDFVQDSYVIGRLKIDPPNHLPVYVMGGSTTREAFVSEGSFAGALRRASGVPVHVYVLSNQNQTFGQSLAMVDNLPAGRGVVAIGINNNRFHFTPAQVALQARGLPLLLASPTLDRFLSHNPPSGLPMAPCPAACRASWTFWSGPPARGSRSWPAAGRSASPTCPTGSRRSREWSNRSQAAGVHSGWHRTGRRSCELRLQRPSARCARAARQAARLHRRAHRGTEEAPSVGATPSTSSSRSTSPSCGASPRSRRALTSTCRRGCTCPTPTTGTT